MRPLLRIRTFLLVFTFCFLMMTVFWFIKYLYRPSTLPFQQVVITLRGEHLEKPLLEKIILDNLQGGFFSLNKNQIESALSALPWVNQVEFRKVWPDKLLVEIDEKKPIAVWNTNALVSEDGQLFYPPTSTFPSGLVYLSAVTDDQLTQVLAKYQQYQSQIATLGLTITALQLDARGSWQMQIDGHIAVVLGRKNRDSRFNQFIALFPKIVGEQKDKLQGANLCYPNGFALRWKNSH